VNKADIINNLSVIRAEIDKRTYSPHEQAEKLEVLSSLLGLAAECKSESIKILATKEKEVMDSSDKGMNLKTLLKLKTIEENALYEYSSSIYSQLPTIIDALRTLISFAKTEFK
jgi:hypothetical protein